MVGETYRTWEDGMDGRGIVHLADADSAGFPLCGANYRAASPDVARRAVCFVCREAEGRWRRALRIWGEEVS